MKKLFSLFLAALLLVSVAPAFADSIPQNVSDETVSVWTLSVYNGSGSDIGTALAVEWDFDTANPSGTYYDDRLPYVQLCDSAGDIWTAGVTTMEKGIANGEMGEIIVRGAALVRLGSTVTAGDIVESDANGKSTPHDGAGTDEGTLGVAIKDTPTGFTNMSIIWINPVQYDKD